MPGCDEIPERRHSGYRDGKHLERGADGAHHVDETLGAVPRLDDFADALDVSFDGCQALIERVHTLFYLHFAVGQVLFCGGHQLCTSWARTRWVTVVPCWAAVMFVDSDAAVTRVASDTATTVVWMVAGTK